MSLPTVPPGPAESTHSVRKGDTGWPAFACQSALIDAGGQSIVLDGDFGPASDAALKRFQSAHNLTSDGLCGPGTWMELSSAVCRRVNRTLPDLPDGVVFGFARGEGGFYGSAVNWDVPGGVDCGLVQQRVYGPPFDMKALTLAFSPYRAALSSMQALLQRANTDYAKPHAGCPFTSIELAVLAHNWPWAAQTYHDDGVLPQPDRPAPWVPVSLPANVRTYDGWAHFYVNSILEG